MVYFKLALKGTEVSACSSVRTFVAMTRSPSLSNGRFELMHVYNTDCIACHQIYTAVKVTHSVTKTSNFLCYVNDILIELQIKL